MAVSGSPTLQQIKNEFGGSGVFSSYRKGAGLVPDTGPNAAVSTSHTGLRLSQFAGATATVPSISVDANWGTITASGSKTSPSRILQVPGGGSRAIYMSINTDNGGMYQNNATGWTGLTSSPLTIGNGWYMQFRTLGAGSYMSVDIFDAVTNVKIGHCYLNLP